LLLRLFLYGFFFSCFACLRDALLPFTTFLSLRRLRYIPAALVREYHCCCIVRLSYLWILSFLNI
jgi:hypothetical protein